MRALIRVGWGCAGLLLFAAAGRLNIARGAPPARCTLSTPALAVLRPAARLYFTAEATNDPAAVTRWMYPVTGPGSVRHPAVSPRTLYGQIFLVDTLGGLDAADLRSRMDRRGSREIVVVPWDYDQSCAIVPTGRFTPIVPAKEVAYFTLTLRPDSLWAGFRPTFDAVPYQFSGFPFGWASPYDFARRGASGYLTARELFSLRDASPAPWGATLDSTTRARLDAWFAANPGLARKYPADVVLSTLLPR